MTGLMIDAFMSLPLRSLSASSCPLFGIKGQLSCIQKIIGKCNSSAHSYCQFFV